MGGAGEIALYHRKAMKADRGGRAIIDEIAPASGRGAALA
jgi:hypothetical protein